MRPAIAFALMLALASCHSAPPPVRAARPSPVVSQDILVRPVRTSQADVLHVLIGWKDLGEAYRGHMTARVRARTQGQAEALARSVLEKARAGESFQKLMKDDSDDLASASTGSGYTVRADGTFEPEFQALALRLDVGEVGVCRSAYGFHVVKRVK
jgi:hypothetical protein